jgi:hypothetical protein
VFDQLAINIIQVCLSQILRFEAQYFNTEPCT